MFSFEGFVRINLFLRGVYRVACLNLLWIAVTGLGLVVFGIGPASYAVAAYIDRWFRLGETPPVTRAFLGHLRAQYWRAAAISWILLAAAAVATTNILAAPSWILRFANVLALIVVGVIAVYVFPVMAALTARSIPRQIASAFLIAVGSLHWTIVAGTAVAAVVWLLSAQALPLLVLFGVGIPASAFGFVTRIVFRDLDDAVSPAPPGERATSRARIPLARGTSQ